MGVVDLKQATRVATAMERERVIEGQRKRIAEMRKKYESKEKVMLALFYLALGRAGGAMTVQQSEFPGIHERLFVKVTPGEDGKTATYELKEVGLIQPPGDG